MKDASFLAVHFGWELWKTSLYWFLEACDKTGNQVYRVWHFWETLSLVEYCSLDGINIHKKGFRQYFEVYQFQKLVARSPALPIILQCIFLCVNTNCVNHYIHFSVKMRITCHCHMMWHLIICPNMSLLTINKIFLAKGRKLLWIPMGEQGVSFWF